MLLPTLRFAAPFALLGLVAAHAGLPAPATESAAPASLLLAAPDEPKLPDTPQGRCVADFIAMMADGSPAAVRAFETKWASKSRLSATPIEDRVPRVAAFRDDLGKVKLARIGAATPTSLTVGVSTERVGGRTGPGGLGGEGEFEFRFDAVEGGAGKLEAIMISMGPPGSASQPLSADARKDTVEGACKALKDNYVYPEVAEKMASSVISKLKAGGYDTVMDEAALARQLTDDMRAISKDLHLGVSLNPAPPEPPSASAEDDKPSPEMRSRMRRDNFAFKKVEILPGNIGYLRFDAFMQDEEAYLVGTAAFGFLKNTDALIIDLRSNGGGSPDSIAFLTTYLFKDKTHLNDMIDRTGKVVEEYWTREEVPGERMPQTPVFVLTSNRTFSGAEEFSYNLKNLKRAVIIGETTGGGAHPVRGERINPRFIIGVPYMRANNPITKTNWEGAGVEPDIKVPATEALERAQTEARAAIRARAASK